MENQKQVVIHLSQDELDELTKAFSRTPNGELSDKDLRSLVSLAVEAWTSTLLGPNRYRTMTELYLSWLGDLYQKCWPEEEPDEMHLFTRLGFPYGRATYLARILREEQPTKSRQRALENLYLALTKVKQRMNPKRTKAAEKIEISQAAWRELNTILSSFIESDIDFGTVRKTATVGNYVRVLLYPDDINNLAKAVEKRLQALKTADREA